jgi:alanine-glyoxylate transaminase/serine-glyoxylate transaminase/serine-pyruvate transaminase
VLIPDALKPREAEIRKTLLAEHNLEIGAGLGALAGQIWRIGLMGFGASEENVQTCLDALEDVL